MTTKSYGTKERFDPLENRTLEELTAAEDDVSEEDFLQQSLGFSFFSAWDQQEKQYNNYNHP